MNKADFISQLGNNPSLDFEDTMAVIEANYDYTPAAFTNGDVENDAQSNQGSAKILAFALLNQLSDAQTLACFGRYYQDVLNTPEGSDHGNNRAVMKTGLAGVTLAGDVLTAK